MRPLGDLIIETIASLTVELGARIPAELRRFVGETTSDLAYVISRVREVTELPTVSKFI